MSDVVTDDTPRPSDPAESLCGLFVDLVPVSGASITVFGRPGAYSTICVSDGIAVELDQLQFDLGEGPRFDGPHRPRRDQRRPAIGRESGVAGLRGRRRPPRRRVGVLVPDPDRLCAAGGRRSLPPQRGPLGVDATARARSIARRVAGPAAERAGRSATSEGPDPRDAPALRREVHQATGMILIQLDVSADEAFAVLRAHAFTQGRTVEDVARDVVQRRLDFRELS